MSSMIAVTVLERTFVIILTGLDDSELAQLTRAWSWCDARLPVTFADIPEDQILYGVLGPRLPVPIDAGTTIAARTFAELADRMTGLITRRAIDARKEDLVMFHAAAVADPLTGGVVAFVGPSGRGKTTVSAALGRRYGYVTDETLAIRDDLTVVPYGKPLSVKLPGEPWKQQVSPSDLELLPPPPALHLVGILLLDRHADEAARLTRIAFTDALAELVPQVSYLSARRRPLDRLRNLAERCGGLRRATYANAIDLMPVVGELFADVPAGRVQGQEAPSNLRSPAAMSDKASAEPGAGRLPQDLEPGFVVRISPSEVLIADEAVVLLVGDTVTAIRGIAPTIWRESASPVSRAQLTRAVVARYGEPATGDASALVDGVIRELVDAEILHSVRE
jgi:hypothetical protein